MKTSLLKPRGAFALAAIATASLPGLSHAESTVSLYGLADAGVGIYRGGGANQTRFASGQDAPSRIGFRGKEDLGGGLSAVFKLEAGLNLADGSGAKGGGLAFNRSSYVGLEGGFGQLVIGRVWSVTDDAWSVHRFNNFSAYIFPEFSNFDRTYPSAIKYTSPTFAGVQASAVYSQKETANDGTMTDGTRELGLTYQGGPASLFASYSETRRAAAAKADKLAIVAGTFKIEPFLIRAAYMDSRPGTEGAGSAKVAMLGADYSFASNWTVGADYLRRSVKGASGGSAIARVLLNYEISQRTGIYAYAARLTNRGGDTQSFSGSVGPNGSQTGINIGIRHRF